MKLGKAEISRGFLLLVAWLWYQDSSGVVWQGLLACLLHEAGHLAALRILGVPVAGMQITVFGAQIKIVGGLSYCQELLAAAAGPAVNLFLAGLACRFPETMAFAGENLILAAFNLLPTAGLDGARILSALLHLVCPDNTAQNMCDATQRICSAFFVAAGLLAAVGTGNVTLSLVALWILKRTNRRKESSISKKKEKGLVMRCRNG